MIYSFWLFDRHSECIYRREWYAVPGAKKQALNSDTAKLVFGIVISLRNITRRLSTQDHFNTYSTSQYKLHYYESPSNIKMVLLTDPKVPSSVLALQQIYSNLYVEYVVKNPLSPLNHSGGAGVDNEIFNMGLDALVRSLPGFS